MTELDSSTVQRNIDPKLKVLGPLEALDLLFVLLVAAIMSFFFQGTDFAFLFVIAIPSVMLIALFFLKKGKPDRYLVHLIRYFTTPGFYSAGQVEKCELGGRRRIDE